MEKDSSWRYLLKSKVMKHPTQKLEYYSSSKALFQIVGQTTSKNKDAPSLQVYKAPGFSR